MMMVLRWFMKTYPEIHVKNKYIYRPLVSILFIHNALQQLLDEAKTSCSCEQLSPHAGLSTVIYYIV